MNIAYTLNNAFVRQVGASLYSLFDNNRDEKEVNVYIVSVQISPENKHKLEEIAKQFERKLLALRYFEWVS